LLKSATRRSAKKKRKKRKTSAHASKQFGEVGAFYCELEERLAQDKWERGARIASNAPSKAGRVLLEKRNTLTREKYARAFRERAARVGKGLSDGHTSKPKTRTFARAIATTAPTSKPPKSSSASKMSFKPEPHEGSPRAASANGSPLESLRALRQWRLRRR
jgi:hypothetical protein